MDEFVKGNEYAQVGNQHVHLRVGVRIRKEDDTFLIKIPSLNVRTYTTHSYKIDERINESISSFLRYWLRQEGTEKFSEQLNFLGFRSGQQSDSALYTSGPSNMVAEPRDHYFKNEEDIDRILEKDFFIP